MKIVSLIPARGGSKSIPKKNLYPINGHPLIDYAITASKSSCINETWVSTDDSEIAMHSRNMGANILMRPSELATDDATTESVMLHFTENVEYDIIVLIQATSPMITSKDISLGITKFKTIGYDSLFSVTEVPDMLIWDRNTKTPINYDYNDRGNRQKRNNNIVIETGGFYITTRENLLKSGCRISGNIGFLEVPFWNMFEVDELEDVLMIEKLMK